MLFPVFPESGAKIYGTPGTGKTWTLIQLFKMAMEQGHAPDRMLMLTYRKSMAVGMAERLSEEVELPRDLKREQIAKTIHSACWYPHFSHLKELHPNIEKIDYMTIADWYNFSRESGYQMLPGDETDFTQASPLYAAYSQARSYRRDYSKVELESSSDISPELLRQVDEALQEFKGGHKKYEYFDTLDFAADSGYCPNVEVLYVDEAQDMTAQMFQLLTQWKKEIPCIILAGDYLQTIYPFYGASPEYMLSWNAPEFTLPTSRRLYAEHWKLATSIIKGCTNYPVPKIETKGKGGYINTVSSDNTPELTKKHIAEGEVFHMARTNSICKKVSERLADSGVLFKGKVSGWDGTEINAYNGVMKIRKGVAPSGTEFKAIAKCYKTNYGRLDKKTLDIIEDPKQKTTSKEVYSVIPWTIIHEWKQGNICYNVAGGKKSDMLIRKFEGALRAGIEEVDEKAVGMVTVCTIHAGKGLEAPTQFLYNELNTATYKSIDQADKLREEALVWYVGLTRASKNLYIVDDFGNKAFPIPRVVM